MAVNVPAMHEVQKICDMCGGSNALGDALMAIGFNTPHAVKWAFAGIYANSDNADIGPIMAGTKPQQGNTLRSNNEKQTRVLTALVAKDATIADDAATRQTVQAVFFYLRTMAEKSAQKALEDGGLLDPSEENQKKSFEDKARASWAEVEALTMQKIPRWKRVHWKYFKATDMSMRVGEMPENLLMFENLEYELGAGARGGYEARADAGGQVTSVLGLLNVFEDAALFQLMVG